MARISTRLEGADERWVENEEQRTRFDNLGLMIGIIVSLMLMAIVEWARYAGSH